MAKSNIKITTEELKLTGTLNTDLCEEGQIILETENGEINLIDYLNGFNGSEIELGLKKKIELPII